MAEFDVPFSPPQYDVYRLAEDAANEGEIVIAFKLTDECLTAITAAHNQRKNRLKLVVDEQNGGTLKIGEATFRFSRQSLPSPFADAVECQKGVGLKARASVGLKYTVQATQNSFEETRVKAQKLMEEEKSRGTKDVNKSKSSKRCSEMSSSYQQTRFAASTATMAHSARASSLGASKQPASMLGRDIESTSRNASPISNPAVNAASAQAARMRVDLLKKSLRERVVHICATARYRSYEDVVGRLRKDGLNREDDSRKTIEDVLREVSELSDSGRVILKPGLYSEVNLKWPWLSSEEKVYIRRTQNPNSAPSSSFAPSRKTGVDRMMAPNGVSINGGAQERTRDNSSGNSSNASNNSSPEAVAYRSPPKGNEKGVQQQQQQGKKRSALSPLAPLPPSSQTDTKDDDELIDYDDELYYATASHSKRKAHAPASKTTPPSSTAATTVINGGGSSSATNSSSCAASAISRAVRQESASPPEDPTMTKEEVIRGSSKKLGSSSVSPSVIRLSSSSAAAAAASTAAATGHHHHHHQQQQQQSGGGSLSSAVSCSSTTSSSSSLQPPLDRERLSSSSPRTDWTAVYGVVQSALEADAYTAAFKACYEEYVEAYSKLSKIADEFTAMERELRACARGSREAEQIESKIRSKYSLYEKDVDFIKLRTRHSDLRCKLATIRSRLESWENGR